MDTNLLRPGAELDGFRIVGKVHEGGMAILYRVEKPGLTLPLVMKVPRLAFGSHPACYVGFEVEQMILSALKGPHVPALVSKGDLEQNPYIVMEFVEGPRLSEAVARAPLPAPEVARLGAALARAVHDLHRQNVIHLDLKPSNVLFRTGGEAVIVDFGLARHGHLPDLVEEEFHMPVGTSAYISPEQVQGSRSDPRSDVFALGVILYELATGALPFGSPGTRAGFRRRLYLDPVPPRRLHADVPAWLQEIILHCLEPNAGERYPTAAQVAHDLSHPDQVPVTGRGTRISRDGLARIAHRWLRSLRSEPAPLHSPSVHLGGAPHLLVAIDPAHDEAGLVQAMRESARRALAVEPHSRVTVIAVQGPVAFSEEETREFDHSLHMQGLMELRHWASPLGLAPEKIRYHVVEGTDAAAAILDYAAAHRVDHIIVGARGSSALRRFLGSVSARVVAEAACTVTAVRAQHSPAREEFLSTDKKL